MKKVNSKLTWFIQEMDAELKVNEWKGGWEDCDIAYLLGRASANLDLIRTAVLENSSDSLKTFAVKCCADCANYCMMITDNLTGRKYMK